METTDNRRNLERMHVRIKGILLQNNIQTKITLVDISKTGFAFISHNDYAIGETCEVEIPHDKHCCHPINFSCIIQNKFPSIYANRFGVEFSESVPTDYLELVESYFKTKRSPFIERIMPSA